ncbi:hypothetical protein ACHAPV_004509 [Trichoderma viride]
MGQVHRAYPPLAIYIHAFDEYIACNNYIEQIYLDTRDKADYLSDDLNPCTYFDAWDDDISGNNYVSRDNNFSRNNNFSRDNNVS